MRLEMERSFGFVSGNGIGNRLYGCERRCGEVEVRVHLGRNTQKKVVVRDRVRVNCAMNDDNSNDVSVNDEETKVECTFCQDKKSLPCPLCLGEGVIGRTIVCRYCKGNKVYDCPICMLDVDITEDTIENPTKSNSRDIYHWTYNEQQEQNTN
mmetsp:Transcript_1360/g.2478  ORF Transcript_1360/g.2478 Transcript_1360/m.2478 type:complete len:153 (+) Transcript_1360:1970-2428(+)